MTEQEFVDWFDHVWGLLSAIVIILMILAALGIVGRWDYEEAKAKECASLGLSYHAKTDTCYGPPKKN